MKTRRPSPTRSMLLCFTWALCSLPAWEQALPVEQPFLRGDSDGDGKASLVDALGTLEFLLGTSSAVPCLDALDADDSGAVDITDAVRLLQYLFGGGAPPSAPFPACGLDPGRDSLDCGEHRACRREVPAPRPGKELAPEATRRAPGLEIDTPTGDPATTDAVSGDNNTLVTRESRALPRLRGGGGAVGTLLALGEVVNGDISTATDIDSYVFSARRGTRITVDRISASNPNGLNWTVTDVWGRVLASDATALNDLGPVALPGGDYTLQVNAEGSGTGTYSFRIVEAPEQITNIALNDLITDSIPTDRPGQRNVHAFTAPPGQSIYLELIPAVSPVMNWELDDAFGRNVVASRRLGDFGPVRLMGGNYQLKVDGTLSGGHLTTGSYQFRVVGLATPPATSIVLGEVVAGEITLPGEVDVFTLNAASGQLIYLDQIATSNSASLDWKVDDALGRTVLAQTNSLADTGPLLLAGGNYQLSIVGEGGATGTYQFRVTDATGSTTSITLGEEVSGEIAADRPGTVHAYELAVAPTRSITIELLSSSNTSSLDWQIEDAWDRIVLARTTSLATTGPIALLGGNYRLKVLPEGGNTGTYRFRVRDDGPISYTPTGLAMSTGQVVDAAITVPGGSASYIFTNGTAGERHYFDLLTGHVDLDWEILDPVGRSMGLVRANSTDGSDLGPIALATGTYTIALRARNAAATPTCTFIVSSAPVTTQPATVGDVLTGSFVGAPGAVHRFNFPVSEGQRVFLDRRIASVRLAWTLLDPVGAAVFPLRRGDGIDNDEGPFRLAGGTYTLVLDPEFGYQPAYEIAIRSVTDAVAPVLPGELVTASFAGMPGATRTHLLTVADGDRFYFERVTASSRLDWSLRDPVGEAVFGPEPGHSADADRGPFTLAAGTYSLVFDPNASYEPAHDFRVVPVADVVAPLQFGTLTASTLSTGAVHTYELQLIEGQRLFFDLQTGHSSLEWSLLDAFDQTVIDEASASGPTLDLGPLNLAAGAYRLVLDASLANAPAYAFTAWNVAVDLTIDEFFADQRVFFASQSQRKVTVSWWARNAGGGPESAGIAVDRLVLSTDALAGNADDIRLGDFLRTEPLAPHATYARSATVDVPATLALGNYKLLVVLDADNVLFEAGGELDNVGTIELQIVADLPAVEPEFLATTSFPFQHVATGVGQFVDVPLSRSISLDAIRHVHAEAASIELKGPRNDTESTVKLSLLSGRDEVLEVAEITASAGQGTGTFMVRFSRRLSPQTIALLPQRIIDGLRFRFDQSPAVTTTLKPVQADGRLRLTFAGCEFAPCGPHLERVSPGAESITFVGTGASEWKTIAFSEAIPGDGLRFISGPHFSATVTNSAFVVAAATSEAQLILDNGALVTLDDSRSPSTLATPSFLALSNSHSLDLVPEQLAGRQILGFQWRVHAASAGLGSATSHYEPRDDFAVRFLYDAAACQGSIALPPVELSPPDGTAHAPGSLVTISGRALSPQSGRPVSAVLVNGEAVDALDAAGRFFKTVSIVAGDNLFAIEVVEPGCGTYQTLLRLQGLKDGVNGLDGYAEASAQLGVEYADTTFRRDVNDLVVRARVRNLSNLPVRGPILMVLKNLAPPDTLVRAAAGLTELGEPFVVLLESGLLLPGEAAPYVALPFADTDRQRVSFDVQWLIPSNRPPYFESSPAARAAVGATYSYDAAALDLDGNGVSFRLDFGPPGMSIDAATGLVTWTPGPSDVGTHDVALTANDGVGGQATQRWTLTVSAAAANRPPYFTTSPVLSVAVGGAYTYSSLAVDPDGESIVYALLSSPAGVTIETTSGRVHWPHALPGQHAIAVEVRDAAGATAVQTFLLAVGSIPTNPSAPRITTSPATEAVAGILFVYQPVATDPDGDALNYSLNLGPTGMTMQAATGRIEWTPRLDQIGAQQVAFSVGDGRGGETSQSFTVMVSDSATNLPPMVESTPGTFALVGQLYEYQVQAIDPEGEAISFSLGGDAAGMAIDDHSGLLQWTPLAADVGSRVVSVRATDAGGGLGHQTFEILVRASNAPPVITSSAPPSTVLAGNTWQYDLSATDADADLLRYEIASGPAALTIQAVTGLATWRTLPADVGMHPIVLRAVDCCGGSTQLELSIEVLADTTPPAAAISFNPSPASVGGVVQVSLSASDDAHVVSRTLSVEQAPDPPRLLQLDAVGRTSYSSLTTGYSIFTGTAVDASGNQTTVLATLQVGNPTDPLDPHPPVVTPIAPLPGSVVTALSSVVATISDATTDGAPGSGPITWTVELAPSGSDIFETIGAGAGELTSAFLATLDPTLRPNGTYRLRITGNDGVQTGGVEYEISIAGNLKLGNYTMSFVDLNIPLAGLPIVVSRRYDSLDPAPGDFGAGWKLALAGEVEDNARESATGNGLVDLLANEPFHPGTRVHVTLPDGRRVGFTFQGQSAGGLFAYAYHPRLQADPGVEETLEVVEPAGTFFLFGGNANQIGIPYNPSVYRLKTAPGVEYLISEADGLQRIEDPNGNSIEVRPEGLFSSTGAAVFFERDANGRIASITEPDDPQNPAPPGELHYFYNAAGNLTAFRDAMGGEVRYFYEDPSHPHHLTRIEDPLGGTAVRTVIDADGRLIAQCGPAGNTTTLEGCTSFDYDVTARIHTSFDAEGNRRDRILDELGQVLTERIFLEDSSTLDNDFTHDAGGRKTSWTLPGGSRWSYSYDERGNLVGITDPAGRERRYTFNDCDRLETETDPLGASQSFQYDQSCNVTLAVNTLGHTTEFLYGARGGLAEVVDANGGSWEFTADANGNPATAVDPSLRQKTSVINAVGELVTTIDRRGRRIDFQYDAAHRVVAETWATNPPRVTTYQYNAAGQLIRIEDPDSVLTIGYHPTGLISRLDNAGSPGVPPVLLELQYDGNGRLTTVEDSLGGLTSYAHDAVGRVVAAEQSGAGVATKRVSFSHDIDSRVVRVERHSDLQGTQLVAATDIAHDTPGDPRRWSSFRHSGPSGQLIHAIELVRDAVGNITSMTDAEGAHALAYDGLGQLLSVDHPAGGAQPDELYVYDSVGHRSASHLSAAYVTSGMLGLGGHQLVQDALYDYESDAEGNCIRRTDRASLATTTFTWDHRNRLTEVTRFDGAGAVVGKTTYVHDALNRRIRVSDGATTRHIIHLGDNPVLELDATGNVQVRRFYGLGLDEVYAEEIAGTTRWLLTDQVGSVRDVLAADGSLLAHHVYDSFGRRLASTGDAGASTLGFQSRPMDAATGLIHLRAREYDPATGRFLSEDLLEPHRYAFAVNNPLSFADPTGKSVLIEYACLASQAVSTGNDFQTNIATPVGALFAEIAAAISSLTPPAGDGGVGAVGKGIGSYLGDVGGFPTGPDDLWELPRDFAIGLFCVEKGAAGDAAKAQGKASKGGPSPFTWTGPSWTK